ncbi:MAG: hypothetical protein ACYTG7_04780 [Planctomycetota bacterium]
MAGCLLASLLLSLPLFICDVPFLCDDYTLILTNLEDGALSAERMADQFRSAPYGVSSRYYRPLFYLSFAFDYALAGTQPWFYYLMNALFHGMTAWLLYLLLAYMGAGRTWALLSAALFLCHPIHIEAITWISARSASLAALFTLGALVLFLRYRRTLRRTALAGLFVMLGLGLLFREVAIITPGIMLAIDLFMRPARWIEERTSPAARRIRLLAPYLVVACLFALYLVVRSQAVGSMASGYSAMFSDLFTPRRLGFVLYSFTRYFVPLMESVTGEQAVGIEVLIALPFGLLALAGLLHIRRPGVRGILAVGLAVFCFATLPSLPILRVDGNLMNTRLFYLPSAGLCILLAAGAFSFQGSPGKSGFSRVTGALLALMIMGGAVLTLYNQKGVIEAGRVCKAFLASTREAEYDLFVVPRTEFFLYADREGDGIKNDEAAFFAPHDASGEEGKPSTEPARTALLINVPKVIKGVYVFWSSLDAALSPVFGRPGKEVLFTEMSPKLNPEGSFFGPLMLEGIPIMKWNGECLVRTFPAEIPRESEAGKDLELARAEALGSPKLLKGDVFPLHAFNPVMTLPSGGGDPGSFRYRAIVPFSAGSSIIRAAPMRDTDLLRFDPFNEPEAGQVFRGLNALLMQTDSSSMTLPDLSHFTCLLYIEKMNGDRVLARSNLLRFRIEIQEP